MRRSPLVLLITVVAAVAALGCTPQAQPPTAASSSENATGAGDAAADTEPPPPLLVGDRAPALSLASLTTPGKITIEPGKVTLVMFWATWNGPCQKSFPRIEDLRVRYGANGLSIAAISFDEDRSYEGASTPDMLRRFTAESGGQFPIGWDQHHNVVKAWRPPLVPTIFLVDKHGIVKHVVGGWRDTTAGELETEIKSLLAAK